MPMPKTAANREQSVLRCLPKTRLAAGVVTVIAANIVIHYSRPWGKAFPLPLYRPPAAATADRAPESEWAAHADVVAIEAKHELMTRLLLIIIPGCGSIAGLLVIGSAVWSGFARKLELEPSEDAPHDRDAAS